MEVGVMKRLAYTLLCVLCLCLSALTLATAGVTNAAIGVVAWCFFAASVAALVAAVGA